jgi:hypothetical protein
MTQHSISELLATYQKRSEAEKINRERAEEQSRQRKKQFGKTYNTIRKDILLPAMERVTDCIEVQGHTIRYNGDKKQNKRYRMDRYKISLKPGKETVTVSFVGNHDLNKMSIQTAYVINGEKTSELERLVAPDKVNENIIFESVYHALEKVIGSPGAEWQQASATRATGATVV